jgi:hypothetical protein
MTSLATGLNTANVACLASCQGNISLTNKVMALFSGMKKPIPGYEGLYEVDDSGRVWSLWRPGMRGPASLNKAPRELKRVKANGGYEIVSLCRNGIVSKRMVHSIVASAFIGERARGFVVDHIDNNPGNNHLSNLRIITHSMNLSRSPKTWARSGHRGVIARKNKDGTVSWRAYANVGGKRVHIGSFRSPEAASRSRSAFVEAQK